MDCEIQISKSISPACLLTIFFALCLLLHVTSLEGQESYFEQTGPGPQSSGLPQSPSNPLGEVPFRQEQLTEDQVPNLVAEVNIIGNHRVPDDQVLARLRTRAHRTYDRDLIQADASEIMRMRFFQNVKTFTKPTREGMVVTFEVVERPFIKKIEIIGNRHMTDRKLKKEIDLKEDMPLDIYAVKLARQKLENYYRDKGYTRSEVTIVEGDKLGDENVIILIHEDERQRIKSISVEGNTFVSEGRLESFLKSKSSVLMLFGGKFNRDQVEQDKQTLISYYHSHGFFNARIGVEIIPEENSSWLKLLFVVDEGPRFSVRNVNFVGQEKYGAEELLNLTELNSNEFFNAAKMQQDETSLRDLYGSQGHIAADIVGEVIYLEDGANVDLVYRIEEGAQYRVGRINVDFEGEHSVTKKQVVLNRIGLKPGDIVDMRKIRDSERRLGASQLFTTQGAPPPKLVVNPRQEMFNMADNDQNVRYQSPDGKATQIIWVDLNLIDADVP
jgi:outer membrane protein insertion porin family